MIEIKERDGAWELPLLVRPGAHADRVVGQHAGRLKVEVKAPPDKGKANRAVEELIAAQLAVRKSAVSVVSGRTSRKKTVRVESVEKQALRKLIQEHSQA